MPSVPTMRDIVALGSGNDHFCPMRFHSNFDSRRLDGPRGCGPVSIVRLARPTLAVRLRFTRTRCGECGNLPIAWVVRRDCAFIRLPSGEFGTRMEATATAVRWPASQTVKWPNVSCLVALVHLPTGSRRADSSTLTAFAVHYGSL